MAALQCAALEQAAWDEALVGITRLCDAQIGQVVALGPDQAPLANWVVNSPADAVADYVRAGGLDPDINPRTRRALLTPILSGFSDDEALSGRSPERFPIYREFDRWDVSHCWDVLIERSRALQAAVVVLNGRSKGPVEREGRQRLLAIAPLVGQALRLQIALEIRAGQGLADAMESVAAAAFLCAADGRVLRQTAAAESLLRQGSRLRLKNGRLQALRAEDDRRLAALLDTASRETAAVSRSVVVADTDGARPLVLDVATLRRSPYSLGFDPSVLVIARLGERRTRTGAEALAQAFGLTESEVAVAAALGRALAPEEIAAERGVSVATVRTQIRSIYAKVGVTRQAQLIRLLHGEELGRGEAS